MSNRRFPITVKRGNVRVKVYATPSNGCNSYTVAYYFGGRRVRQTFADLSLAEQEAATVANRICAGELDVLTLTSADRAAYVRAMAMLQPVGTPLEMAVMQFLEAAKILQGQSLVEAAKFFTQHHSTTLPRKAVAEVVAELLEAKRVDGVSEVYLKDLKTRLMRFAEAFPGPVQLVLAAEIQDYLRSLKLSGRSKNNTRKVISVLFHYAQSRGYLPKGLTEADGLPLAKERNAPIGIFTPAEMARLLAAAKPELVAFLAVGAFAGLRHAEIVRLDWSEIDLESGFIEVKPEKAKTASRRLVPVADNLRLWLTPRHAGTGKVVPLPQVSQCLTELAEAAGVAWQHNGLRHSFISYRVAQVQNVAQVALEAGNSPKIIFSNYRELVKPADATKWFGIVPEKPAAIVAEPQQAEPVLANA